MLGRAALAALSAFSLTLTLWAQRGGMAGGHGGFAAHSGGFAAHGPVMAGHSGLGFNRGGFVGGPHRGVPFGSAGFRGSFGFRSPFFFHNRFRHHHFFSFGFYPSWYYGYWGYPGYGYYSYPSYYDPSGYEDDRYREEAQNEIEQERDEVERERNDIGRLEDEIERLRLEKQPAAKPESKDDIHSLTVLVFRDRHTEEVQNYALIGQTLWILNEEKAKKIPLSDLDVPATVKANDERGLDFRVPR